MITHDEYITHVIDSVVVKDSVVVIPVETYVNMTWNYDTLSLETSLAKAEAWVDSCWLRGSIKNKDKAQFQYIYQDKWHVKDSIVYQEKPVPYEVEKVVTKNASWKVWLWAILSSLGLIGMLYWHFRKWIYKLFSGI